MDKERKAIERLRLAAQMSETYYEQPLIITTSGGKDSDVCLHLAETAGINYEVQHNHTTADAPETVRHLNGRIGTKLNGCYYQTMTTSDNCLKIAS